MPGFNPDKLNIHDLTVEETEKETEVVFDPERDLSDDDWTKLRRGFDNITNTNLLKVKYGMAAQLIDSSRSRDFFVDHDDIAGAVLGSQEAKYKNTWSGMSDKIIEEKLLLFPESFKDFQISDENLEINLMTTEELKKENKWGKILRRAGLIKIVRPESFKDLKFDKATWDSIREYLQTEIQAIRTSGDRGSTCVVDLLLAKILAAEDVKITPNGFEFVMPKEKEKLTAETPQVPEQRSF